MEASNTIHHTVMDYTRPLILSFDLVSQLEAYTEPAANQNTRQVERSEATVVGLHLSKFGSNIGQTLKSTDALMHQLILESRNQKVGKHSLHSYRIRSYHPHASLSQKQRIGILTMAMNKLTALPPPLSYRMKWWAKTCLMV